MFTTARLFFAINFTLAGALTLGGSDILPMWARYAIGLATLFTSAMLAFNGPVQNSAAMNVVAKEAVVAAKAAGG